MSDSSLQKSFYELRSQLASAHFTFLFVCFHQSQRLIEPLRRVRQTLDNNDKRTKWSGCTLCTGIFEASLFPEWHHGCVGLCWIIEPHGISLCLRYERSLLCCLCIPLAYCVGDGEVMCSESSKSFVLPCSLKKGVASGINVIHGERVIPSKTGQTDFRRFLLLWGRKQLKGRAEFQIIPEYMRCTQLFLVQCSLTLWCLLRRGNGTRLWVSHHQKLSYLSYYMLQSPTRSLILKPGCVYVPWRNVGQTCF